MITTTTSYVCMHHPRVLQYLTEHMRDKGNYVTVYNARRNAKLSLCFCYELSGFAHYALEL